MASDWLRYPQCANRPVLEQIADDLAYQVLDTPEKNVIQQPRLRLINFTFELLQLADRLLAYDRSTAETVFSLATSEHLDMDSSETVDSKEVVSVVPGTRTPSRTLNSSR